MAQQYVQIVARVPVPEGLSERDATLFDTAISNAIASARRYLRSVGNTGGAVEVRSEVSDDLNSFVHPVQMFDEDEALIP